MWNINMKNTKKIVFLVLAVSLLVLILFQYYPWKQEAEKRLPTSATEINIFKKTNGWNFNLYLLKAKLSEKDFLEYHKIMNFAPISDDVMQKYDFHPNIWNLNVHDTKIPSWWNPSEETNNMYYDPTKIALDRIYIMKYENGYLFYLKLEI
jgi:hypothetical protein